MEKKQRFEIIDALRGFALAGIVIVHMVENYVGAPVPEEAMAPTHQGIPDYVIDGFIMLFLRGKFFALFSFLFGLSFFIQMKNAEVRGHDFKRRFLWRLLLLFGIGYLHHLFYRGDILTVYAMLGVFLIPFYSIKNKMAIYLAAILFLGLGRYLVFMLAGGPSLFFEGELNPENPAIIAYFEVIKTGNILEVFKSNAISGLLMKMDFQFGIFSRAYLTFGFFLLGLVAGRLQLFQHYMEHRRLLKKMLVWSAVLFFISLISGILIFSQLGEGASFNSWLSMLGLTAFDLNNIAMTFLLLGLFVALYRKDRVRKFLYRFAPYGRMALTNYVLQSVLGSYLYYGWGLGLVGEMRNVYSFALALFIIIFQMAISKWWLKHFYYGPFEWMWRSLTFLRQYPLKKTGYA
jgi:uncharacterized protein